MRLVDYKGRCKVLKNKLMSILNDYSNYDIEFITNEDSYKGQCFIIKTLLIEDAHSNEYVSEQELIYFKLKKDFDFFNPNLFFKCSDAMYDEFKRLGDKGLLDSILPILDSINTYYYDEGEQGNVFIINLETFYCSDDLYLNELLCESICGISSSKNKEIEFFCNQSERKNFKVMIKNQLINLHLPIDQSYLINNKNNNNSITFTDQTDNNYIFVIMSFRDAPRLKDVYITLKRTVTEHQEGLICERVDEIDGDYVLTDKIIECIKKARVVIADMTDNRPNVYYELGYARGIGKKVILIADKNEKTHFDIRNENTIFYESMSELESRVKKRLVTIFKYPY